MFHVYIYIYIYISIKQASSLQNSESHIQFQKPNTISLMMKSKIFEAKIFSIESIPLLFLHIKEKKRKKKFREQISNKRENLVFFWKSGSVDRGRTREVDEASRGLLKVVEKLCGMHKVDWKNDNWSGLVNGGSHEKRLLNDLLDTYNVLERPVGNESEPLVLSFGLTLMQIIDVVSFQTAT